MKIRRESGISKYLTIILYLFPGNFVLQKDYCQPYYVTDPQNTLRKMQIVVVVIGFSKQSHDMRLKKHRRAGACSRRVVKCNEFTLVSAKSLLPSVGGSKPPPYRIYVLYRIAKLQFASPRQKGRGRKPRPSLFHITGSHGKTGTCAPSGPP